MDGSIDPLLRKLRLRDLLGAEEERALGEAAGPVRVAPANTVVVRRGVPQDMSKLLLEGFVARAKDLADGTRQILALHIAGDFVDLHSFLLKRLDHDIVTLSPVRFIEFPHAALQTVTERYPHLTRMLWFSTLLDASIQREAMLSLGRRSSEGRLAHLFCELQLRLSLVGHGDPEGFALPLSQIELSEVAGITPVHVNRVLRSLREQQVVTFQRGRVHLQDLVRLRGIAQFTEDYLHLVRGPL